MALTKATKPRKGMVELDYETFDENNIDNTGTTDVTAQIQELLDRLYAEGKRPVQNKGTYYVNGTLSMKLRADANLKGCTFVPGPAFKGSLTVTQPEQPIIYGEDSGVVAAVNASSVMSRRASSGQLDGLYDVRDLEGKYCVFTGSQGMYWSRNKIHTWQHRALMGTYGFMSNTLRYALAENSCTKVVALPVKPEMTYCYLPNFDLRNTPHNINIIVENLTRAEIVAGGVIGRPLVDTGSEYLIKMYNCYSVHIKGLQDRANLALVNNEPVSTYSLVVNNCLNCTIEDVIARGVGWGAQEGESSTDITFIRCDLSRYDFHSPFQGFCKIIDCKVGNHGVMMCGMGLLYIERTGWYYETLKMPEQEIHEVAMVKTRDDYGGWFDGDLVMVDCYVCGGPSAKQKVSADFHFIAGTVNMSYTNQAGQILPPDSPVRPTLFNNITVRGLKFERWLDGNRFTQMLYTSPAGQLYHPRSFKMEDVDFNCGGEVIFRHNSWKTDGFDASKTASPLYADVTHTFDLENIACNGLSFISDVAALNPNVRVTGLKNLHGTPPKVKLHQRGIYNFDSCHVSSYSTSWSDTVHLSRPLALTVTGGAITAKDVLPLSITQEVDHCIIFNGVSVAGDLSHTEVKETNTKLAAWAKLQGCNFYRIGDGKTIPFLLLWSGVASEQTDLNIYVASGSQLYTRCIYNSRETIDTFEVPRMTGYVGRAVFNGQSSGYFISQVMRGSRALFQNVTAPCSLRAIGVM